nr:zinc finger, CCHC-type [Tanacetum cinerariifolium]
KKELAIPEQTTTGKGLSNPSMAGSLPKTTLPTQLVLNDVSTVQLLLNAVQLLLNAVQLLLNVVVLDNVLDIENEVIEMKSSYQAKIAVLESTMEKLEEDNRKITDIDADAEVNLENVYNLDLAHEETVLSTHDATDADGKEVAKEMVEVITTAKIIVDEASNVGGELNAANEEPVSVAPTNITTAQPNEEVTRRIEAEWNADMQDNIDWNKEAEELKRNLEIVPNDEDDVFVNVTPLSSKPPTIVDYKIYKEGKKEHFQIIRANGIHQMYLAFSTMLKNFEKEDLEALWKIVKERFNKSQPKEVLDVDLWHTLKMFNEVRLQVDYEVEMAYDLLRLDEALDKFKVFKTKVELQQGSLIKRFRTDKEGEYMDTLYFHYVVVPEKVTKEVVQQPEPELRKRKRHRTPKYFGPEFQLHLFKGTRDEVSGQHSYCFNVEDDPKTFDEAIKSQDVTFWKEQLMMRWTSSWGFKQKSGIDYFVTYAPVARISTIRLLIAMTSIHSLIIHQMDVNTSFLNGELDEEVPKQWHQKFNEVVLSNGYLPNQANKCVYSKFDESGKEVIICLHVDDMLIFGTNQVQVDLTKEFLSLRFSMKDIGEADVILSIRIKYESNEIAISQSHYIENVLKKFNYFNCTLVSTPIDTSEKLMPINGQAVSQLEYSRVIGCLMYAMPCTRPDIAFVLGKLSRYTSNPVLEGYTDASWISNTKDNSSTSGCVFLLGSGLISWASKKQTCITGSTMEYEFVALADAGKEAEWLKNLLLEIPLWVKPIASISI